MDKENFENENEMMSLKLRFIVIWAVRWPGFPPLKYFQTIQHSWSSKKTKDLLDKRANDIKMNRKKELIDKNL